MFQMTMTLDQDSDAVKKLIELRKTAKNLRPVFHHGADEARARLTKRFDSAGDGTWAPLAASTIEMRRRRTGYYRWRTSGEGPRRRILHWSLRMRKSLTQKGHRFHVSRAPTNRTFVFGTRDPKAYHHQNATGRRLPRRVVLPIPEMKALFFITTRNWFQGIIDGKVA